MCTFHAGGSSCICLICLCNLLLGPSFITENFPTSHLRTINCVYIYIYMWNLVCLLMPWSIYACLCARIYMYMYPSVYVYMHICIYMCVCVKSCVLITAAIYLCMFAFVCVYVYLPCRRFIVSGRIRTICPKWGMVLQGGGVYIYIYSANLYGFVNKTIYLAQNCMDWYAKIYIYLVQICMDWCAKIYI